jgi:hypothetical protein
MIRAGVCRTFCQPFSSGCGIQPRHSGQLRAIALAFAYAFADEPRPAAACAHALIARLALPALTAVAEREVAKAADGLLSMNLADLAATGCKRYKALRQAGYRTRTAPTAEEIVALATHRTESSHHPTIDVYIDGKSVVNIEVAINGAFNMAGVLAVVRQAHLVAIKSGNCTVSGNLAVHGVTAAQKQRRFDLPGRSGIALLAADESPTPVGQKVVSDAQSESPSADWYPDPTRRYQFRWWDGSRWTHRVAANSREMWRCSASRRTCACRSASHSLTAPSFCSATRKATMSSRLSDSRFSRSRFT